MRCPLPLPGAHRLHSLPVLPTQPPFSPTAINGSSGLGHRHLSAHTSFMDNEVLCAPAAGQPPCPSLLQANKSGPSDAAPAALHGAGKGSEAAAAGSGSPCPALPAAPGASRAPASGASAQPVIPSAAAPAPRPTSTAPRPPGTVSAHPSYSPQQQRQQQLHQHQESGTLALHQHTLSPPYARRLFSLPEE